MLFNSISFAIFLPIVFLLYWVLPHRFRWFLLLLASYYFYMSWNAKYVVLILFVTVISYLCALLVERADYGRAFAWRKRACLAAALVPCLGLLFLFKYWNFTFESLERVFRLISLELHPVTLQLMLPVGISFYTFQAISYVVDVYRGDIKAEHHFGRYAAFVSFFPQLVAGPIERTGNLLPQIQAEHRFDYETASCGLKLMAWGFFKKLVIADPLAVYVDQVYGNLHAYQGLPLLLASLFFTFQIYCDFSGYSDIAIGTANLFGIRLMQNFKSPYFSASLREFWKRWHISLSSWFQDYVYIPLGGSRCQRSRNAFNVMLTFFVSGLWHGANWHFVVWGGVHGFFQVIENCLPGPGGHGEGDWSFRRILRILLVFCFVNLAWIFFRVGLTDALYVIGNLFVGIGHPLRYFSGEGLQEMGLGVAEFLRLCFCISLLMLYDFIELKVQVMQAISGAPVLFRWMCYYAVGACVFLWGIQACSTTFIYFQF